jgi:isocitrate dehydrogenase
MVIFRENTEDIYAGIEYQTGTPENKKLKDFLINEMGTTNIRFPETSSLGIKPISIEGTKTPGSRSHQLRHRSEPKERDPCA